jgi:hypothetical protein
MEVQRRRLAMDEKTQKKNEMMLKMMNAVLKKLE